MQNGAGSASETTSRASAPFPVTDAAVSRETFTERATRATLEGKARHHALNHHLRTNTVAHLQSTPEAKSP